ncbi:MAG: PEP-CTERM sorting domain-containing protein [Phenylobacterium sp.]|uniref:PEPxxWA-CTERM sorting domain-containing protein n=1 Tax=Phenylobacterium sp. TaxID=1871053 RepID=UPI001A4B210A|nr:PEPxxWA-CTERM sorting domain-containing protein [Phenylobacterium sp.]MBL8769820.1 PEP-CTERM sorting domain-containing protein [Phenylobacterium sp.]
MTWGKFTAAAAAVALAAGVASSASAANLAIFGQNNIGSWYTGLGHSVTYVSDAQLATSGFLNSYDAFVYTRDGSSFGVGLSATAAANVKAYVSGNVVLFNGDFQDGLGSDATTGQLFTNAINYVLSNPGGGYIGEYRGSFAAFATNDQGINPIGLVQGNAGPHGGGEGGSSGNVNATAIGAASSLLAGVSLPYNDTQVEFGATVTGYNPNRVILEFDNGNPALIASNVDSISAGVPEPSTWAMMLMGFGGVGALLRGARRRFAFA